MDGRRSYWTLGEKFREMILYLAAASAEDPRFGMVKLQKLMYYSDFTAYRELGRSISSVDYYHMQNGPMADGLKVAVLELEGSESVVIEREYRPSAPQPAEVVRPRREPYREMFSDEERRIMDDLVRRHWSLNGAQISDLVHDEPGWRLTERGEKIPYETAWLAPTRATPAKLQFARELAAKNGVLG
jgi:hypothetical protein